jgi:hypothetical protein
MKWESQKSKKQQTRAGMKAKPVCGTLSYLAECRGMTQKAGSARWPELSAEMEKKSSSIRPGK